MSALPPRTDMLSVKIDVCFVPLADMLPAQAFSNSPMRRRRQFFTCLTPRLPCVAWATMGKSKAPLKPGVAKIAAQSQIFCSPR